MKKIFFTVSIVASLGGLLTGCANISNTPKPFPLKEKINTSNVKLSVAWKTKVGNGNGGQLDIKLKPALYDGNIFTSSYDGIITDINGNNGKKIWSTSLPVNISSPVAVSDNTVVFGTLKGKLYGLNSKNGKQIWSANIPSSLFSKPLISNKVIYILTHDGSVSAYNLTNGKQIWQQQTNNPALILINNSSPVMSNGTLIVGTSSGDIWGFNPDNGNKIWSNPVSLPNGISESSQIISINSTPLVDKNNIYVATYQGSLVALNKNDKSIKWRKKASIFNQYSADKNNLFVTNSSGSVISYSEKNGSKIWQQDALKWRGTTGTVYFKNMVIVSDYQGFVHVFNAMNGKYLSRLKISDNKISSQGIIVKNRVVLQDSKGDLIAINI